jgi:hypothetical protein
MTLANLEQLSFLFQIARKIILSVQTDQVNRMVQFKQKLA